MVYPRAPIRNASHGVDFFFFFQHIAGIVAGAAAQATGAVVSEVSCLQFRTSRMASILSRAQVILCRSSPYTGLFGRLAVLLAVQTGAEPLRRKAGAGQSQAQTRAT